MPWHDAAEVWPSMTSKTVFTRDVVVQRGLRIPMPDGTVLLADRWAPRAAGASSATLPTALYRSPYGRRGMFGLMLGRMMAERGFQVVIQSARGTFGSGGVFDPMRQEREDGLRHWTG
jgi:predicted acyl esterase